MTDPAASGAAPGPELDPERVARAFEGQAPAFLEEPDLLQRLNLIRHLIQSTRMTVLVTGPEGVGKTACLDQLQRGAEPRWLLCRIAGATTTDPDRALARLARCCDLPPDCGRPALRQLLTEHAAVVNRGARLPVIAVDDAHGLEPAALQELVALSSPAAGWRLLLLAEPGHDDHWAAAGLASAAQLHRLEWPPLSESQTGAYVLHRLRSAGWTGAQPLNPEQLRKLHRDSAGLPGAVNRLAPSLLARQSPAPRPAAAPRRRPFGGKSLRFAALALAIAAVGLVLWQQERINELFQPPEQAAPAPAPLPKAETTAQAPTPAPASEVPPAAAPEPEPGPVAGPEPIPEPAPESVPESAPESAPGPLPETSPPAPEPPPQQARAPATPPTGEQPAQPAAPQQARELDTALAAPQTGTDSQPPPPTTEPQRPEAAAQPEPEPAPVPGSPSELAPAPEPAEPAEPTEPSPAATAAVEQEQPAPAAEQVAEPETAAPQPDQPPAADAPPTAPAEPAATAPAAPAVASGAGWVLAQEPSHYTLQLLGSRERKAVTDIIERYQLGEDAAWYKIQYRGGDWYVLVYGAYPDSRAAGKALAQLPAGLRRAGPWPRPLSAVQSELRRGRK